MEAGWTTAACVCVCVGGDVEWRVVYFWHEAENKIVSVSSSDLVIYKKIFHLKKLGLAVLSRSDVGLKSVGCVCVGVSVSV